MLKIACDRPIDDDTLTTANSYYSICLSCPPLCLWGGTVVDIPDTSLTSRSLLHLLPFGDISPRHPKMT